MKCTKWDISIIGVFGGIVETRKTIAYDYNTAKRLFTHYKTLARKQVKKHQVTRYNSSKQETNIDNDYVIFLDEYGNTQYSVIINEKDWGYNT